MAVNAQNLMDFANRKNGGPTTLREEILHPILAGRYNGARDFAGSLRARLASAGGFPILVDDARAYAMRSIVSKPAGEQPLWESFANAEMSRFEAMRLSAKINGMAPRERLSAMVGEYLKVETAPAAFEAKNARIDVLIAVAKKFNVPFEHVVSGAGLQQVLSAKDGRGKGLSAEMKMELVVDAITKPNRNTPASEACRLDIIFVVAENNGITRESLKMEAAVGTMGAGFGKG